MGFFGFGKKKEKEQQSAQAEETRLEAQADETSGAENAQTAAGDAEQAAQDVLGGYGMAARLPRMPQERLAAVEGDQDTVSGVGGPLRVTQRV